MSIISIIRGTIAPFAALYWHAQAGVASPDRMMAGVSVRLGAAVVTPVLGGEARLRRSILLIHRSQNSQNIITDDRWLHDRVRATPAGEAD
jgi:hypothetical protein